VPFGYPRRVIVVLMGVSGVGKTTVGRLLVDRLGWEFLDGDDFHPPVNKAKMARGEPLTDADRGPWLDVLAAAIRRRLESNVSAVLACSALKEAYRERLRVGPEVRFVHLRADAATLRQRLEQRQGHYFQPGLLASQLEALEEPSDALTVDASATPGVIASQIMGSLGIAED
jgi:gluconokinase